MFKGFRENDKTLRFAGRRIKLFYDIRKESLLNWIGHYFKEHTNIICDYLVMQLANQYGGYSSKTEAVRVLVGIKQWEDDSMSNLIGTILSLAIKIRRTEKMLKSKHTCLIIVQIH